MNTEPTKPSVPRLPDETAIPAKPRLKFVYADLGAGSRNPALACDLTRAIDADISYCVGPADVEQAVAREAGRRVLFTNFSLKTSAAPARGMQRLSQVLGIHTAGPVPAALKKHPHHAAAFRFLQTLLRCHPELQVHVLTEAPSRVVPDAVVLALAAPGRVSVQRKHELGQPLEPRKFIRYVVGRLAQSYGHRDFERPGWDVDHPGVIPQGLPAAELAARFGFAGSWDVPDSVREPASRLHLEASPENKSIEQLAMLLSDQAGQVDGRVEETFSVLWADSFPNWRLGYGLLAVARAFPRCRYFHAADHEQAHAVAAGKQIQVLVTNFRPGLQEFIRTFQQQHPESRVIVCSGVVTEEGVQSAGAVFCDKRFFAGPAPNFYGAELIRKIRVLLPKNEKDHEASEALWNLRKHWRFHLELPARDAREEVPPDELEQRLQQQLAGAADNPGPVLWELARFYNRTRRPDQALPHLERLLSLDNRLEPQAACLLALGQTMEQKSDYPAAIQYYRQALRLEPGRDDTWYWLHNNLGYCLNQTGQPAQAEPFCRQAISIQPGRHNAHKNLGLACASQGRWPEAVGALTQAIRNNAADLRALRHLEDLAAKHPEVKDEYGAELELCAETILQAKFELMTRLRGGAVRAGIGSQDAGLIQLVSTTLRKLHDLQYSVETLDCGDPQYLAGRFAAWGCTLIVLHPEELFRTMNQEEALTAGLELVQKVMLAQLVPVIVVIDAERLKDWRPLYLELGVDEVLSWPVPLNSLALALGRCRGGHHPDAGESRA